jgi:hypothetical protein
MTASTLTRLLRWSTFVAAAAWPALSHAAGGTGAGMPWWVWPVVLFVVCFALGLVAVPAGIGGGVLFVPIVSGFFPFHLDFVRGAGLLVALAGALAAGPGLLRTGLADLRLALPFALVGSVGAIVARWSDLRRRGGRSPRSASRSCASLRSCGARRNRTTPRSPSPTSSAPHCA